MTHRLIFPSEYILLFLTLPLPLITQELYSSIYIYIPKLYLIKKNQTLSKYIKAEI